MPALIVQGCCSRNLENEGSRAGAPVQGCADELAGGRSDRESREDGRRAIRYGGGPDPLVAGRNAKQEIRIILDNPVALKPRSPELFDHPHGKLAPYIRVRSC